MATTLGSSCMWCEDGVLIYAFEQVKERFDWDCYACGGSGLQYGFDDMYMKCFCARLTGKKERVLRCNSCESLFDDECRASLSARIRSDIQALERGDDRFKLHIESLFEEGMTWCNRSSWHIDHIKPICQFLDEGVSDVDIVNCFSNLRPLWAAENLKKGGR